METDNVETEQCDRLLKLVSKLPPAMKLTQMWQKSSVFVIWQQIF